MRSSVNTRIFPRGTPIADQARLAAQVGFSAMELCLQEAGEFSLATTELTCRALDGSVRGSGLEVTSVQADWHSTFDWASPDPAPRIRAMDLTLASLDRAAWVGADVLTIVPAWVGMWNEPRIRVSYVDALNRTFDALSTLSAEAEVRGVCLAIENAWNRFLLSPIEMRDLIDQVNSPMVGVCLDVGSVMVTGYPEDWIRILDRRIRCVHLRDFKLEGGGLEGFCPLGEGHVNWPMVVSALRDVGYDGALTYVGRGELSDVRRRVGRILSMGISDPLG
jgi:L-ribulose-5-phosphate 3-epimerase